MGREVRLMKLHSVKWRALSWQTANARPLNNSMYNLSDHSFPLSVNIFHSETTLFTWLTITKNYSPLYRGSVLPGIHLFRHTFMASLQSFYRLQFFDMLFIISHLPLSFRHNSNRVRHVQIVKMTASQKWLQFRILSFCLCQKWGQTRYTLASTSVTGPSESHRRNLHSPCNLGVFCVDSVHMKCIKGSWNMTN